MRISSLIQWLKGAGFGILMLLSSAMATPLPWLGDLDQAKEQARQSGKGIMIFFDGLDTSEPLERFEKNVLENEAVSSFMMKHFVPVKFAFTTAPEEGKDRKEDQALSDYQVDAYPTIVFTTFDGIPVSKYMGDMSAEELIGSAEKAARVSEAVLELTRTLSQTKDQQVRFKLIGDILRLIPDDDEEQFVPEIKAEIEKDVQDVSGMKAELAEQRRQVDEQVEWDAFLSSIPQEELDVQQRVCDLVDGYMNDHKDLLPLTKQMILVWKCSALGQLGRFDEMVALMDECIRLAPFSQDAGVLRKEMAYFLANRSAVERAYSVTLQFEEFNAYYNNFPEEIRLTPALCLKVLKDYDQKENLAPELRQQIWLMMAKTLLMDGHYDEAVNLMQQAVDLAPFTQVADFCRDDLLEIKENKEGVLLEMKRLRDQARQYLNEKQSSPSEVK